MDTEKILQSLTTDEKIRLLAGVGNWHTYDCNGKVPVIMMTDGPHGLRKVEDETAGDIETSKPATCFPTASAVACSFNPELSRKMANAIADEAKKEKISIVLGCGVNIKRSPFCGRNFEYYSEDPFLAGKMATGFIKGMQENGVGTSLKHFAVNSQETRRMTSNSQVDERALHEIYLAAFEETVKEANPTTLMASYNRVCGHFATSSEYLLNTVLRDKWGYKGSVISDWGATNNVVNCMKAGMNLEMPDPQGFHTGVLQEAYAKGEITDKELDSWAENILKNLSSLSEKVVDDYNVDYDKHNEIARNIENECAVLLKNRGILPISTDNKIIVIGDMAVNMRFQGGGSSHINPTKVSNALESLKKAGYEVTYIKGYDSTTEKEDAALMTECFKMLSSEYVKGKTKILFFLGLTDSFEGEGYDRTSLDIPAYQTDLLERVAGIASISDIAAISFGGAPMDFSWEENVSAVLHMYLGGQAVGESVADLVSGRVNPSGRLAETIPLVRTDTPAWRYFALPNDDVEYRESIFVGYRYYETFDVPVRYPFGYGLSYTDFEYSNMKCKKVYSNGTLKVNVTIKNTGSLAGAEVVQIYVKNPKSDCIRSAIELRGFKKVFLEPGESKEVEILLNERSFSAYLTNRHDFAPLDGTYTVCAGSSVKDLRLEQDVHVEGEHYFRNERMLFPDYFKPQPHGMDVSKEQFEELYGMALSDEKNRKRGDFSTTCSFEDVTKKSIFGWIVRGVVGIALKFMYPGKDKSDPGFMMVKMTIQEGNLEGLITTSGGAISPKLVDMLVLNANRNYGRAFIRMFKK